MKNLQLKIVNSGGGRTGSPLCESCAYGMILRGEGMEFTWCAYMRDYVSMRVESCTRYTESPRKPSDDSSLMQLISEYTLD
jgi:hypothetical protein